jgi:hypothetical protein
VEGLIATSLDCKREYLMKMKVFLKTILFIIIIAFLSCDNDNPVIFEIEKSEGMIPYKVGYKWTWNHFKINGDEKSFMEQYTVEVIRDTIINGEKWYIERENNSFNVGPSTNREGVTYVYNNGAPKIIFNTSIEDTSLASTNSNRSYLVSENNVVEIPLGKFKCNLYHFYQISNGKKWLSAKYYISYNKGIIKIENFGCIDSLCSTSALELASTNVF